MKKTPSHTSGSLSFFKNNLPKPVKRLLRWPYLKLLDLRHWYVNGIESPIPAPSTSNMEADSYKLIGEEFFGYLQEFTDLSPVSKVLDVGCGWGRLALPFIPYLSEEGEYNGFEIIPNRVDWARKRISSKHPNFQFKLVEVKNLIYSESGMSAADLRFPYDDNSFDVVFLNSVFTHMLPGDVEHYLSEIRRVLKPGGRSLCTYFLLNEESRALIKSGKSMIDFKYSMDGFMTNDEVNPEEAIAFPEDFVLTLYGKYDLSVDGPVKYGSWCQRESFLSFQDIIVAKKQVDGDR